VCAAALGGCVSDGGPAAVAQGPAGATIAFESIDGPPRPVFDKMVDSLKRAAARKQLAVVTREGAAAYRVRGYMAANVIKGRTHIDWVWDVYDVGRQRSLRITGDEATNRGLREAWAGADDATVGRIADTSIERLAAFVGGAPVAPSEPVTASGPAVAEAETPPAAAQGDAPPAPRKPQTAQTRERSLAALRPSEGR
jgi:hypothetical protein